MAYNELDKMKLEYTVPSVGNYQRIEPTEIYLAKPGKRTIGKLNGIDETSCHLEINLQNTAVLEFSMSRIVDGEVSNFYDIVDQHYELFAKGYGWFKINEEPQIENDGTMETKSVRAESLEIELQQFDLVGFQINTGEAQSFEMRALDNTYEAVDGYYLPRTNIKFWRDLSKWDAFIENFPVDGTESDLIIALQDPDNQFLYDSWRIEFDLDEFDEAIRDVIRYYEPYISPSSIKELESFIGKVTNQQTAFVVTQAYPDILHFIHPEEINLKYTDEYGDEQTGTVYEILNRERQRLSELSFLDLVLKETGWKVGFVDPVFDPNSEDESEREPLADRIGYFQVDTQDVYSFITQEAADYYRCVFDFDTENYAVNAYKVETLGKDTNIFLNFHNIQNSVTRSSDRKFYTVYHVANGTGDDSIDITEANFGRDAIEDISYFLNKKHFPQDLIDKYNEWYDYKEAHRNEYMDLAVDYRNKQDIAHEIDTRVPVDAANSQQYSSFTVEELSAELENQRAQKRGYKAMHVDDEGEFDPEDLENSRDWPAYYMITEVVLSKPDPSIMTMDLNDDILEEIFAANEIKRELPELADKVEKYTEQIAEINEQIQEYRDSQVLTPEEKTQYIAEATARLNEVTANKQEAQSSITSKQSELEGYEADITAYHAEHEYEGIINDDTIGSVMMYSLQANHLGLIETELYNRWLVNATVLEDAIETLEFDEDYMYNFDRYGICYGVQELKIQLKNLENKVALEKQYVGKQDQSDEYHKKHLDLYYKYLDAYESCAAALEERQQEYDDAMDEVKQVAQQMLDLSLSVEKENFIDSHGNHFTAKELWLLQRYYIHTDYINDNIVTTDMFTNEKIVQTEYDLYNDALEQLYADSHPQWQYQTSQDNFLLMPELQGWHGDLEIGNFIRVGFREDDPYYIRSADRDNQVKLRLTTIGLNPFMIEPTIDLTFSTMIQYKSKRNDFVEIIGSASGGSGKNQISATYTGSKDNTVNITGDFITKLLNNGSFGAGVVNIVSGSGALGGFINNAISDLDISVDQIGDLRTRLSDLVNGYVDANVITTKVLYADQAHIDDLQARVVTSDKVVAGLVDATDVQAQTVASKLVTADTIVSGLVDADEGDFSRLTAQTGFIEYLNSGIIDAGTVSADTIIAGLASVTSEQISKFNLLTNSAFANYLESTLIVATEIRVNDLKAKLATIDSLTAGSAFVNYLQGLSSTVVTSVVDDSYIANAVVGKITAGQLAAGDITLTDSMRIVSENGQMIMNGRALQILGEDSQGNDYVGIQLGYDTNDNPSLILRNEDGATILTPDGITSNAIADGLIVNDMIGNNTISKTKLGFQVIEPNAQGGVDITQVYDGSGNLWGVQYTQFKQGTEQALDDLEQQIEDSATYSLYIEAPNGTNIRGGNVTLTARLFKNSTEVTSEWSSEYFHWTRHSQDTDGDIYWNEQHSTGAKTIIITANEVSISADFQCYFSANGITVSSS